MSHRTKHLGEASWYTGIIRELRYHEPSRQILAIVLIVLFTVNGYPTSYYLFYIGAVTISGGVLLRLWASGLVKKNEELATDGPYAMVRHPLYSGNILILTGFALTSQSWWWVPAMIGLLIFYYPPAIEYEDMKLHRLFGKKWESWSENTRALWPGLNWRGISAKGAGWSMRQSTLKNGEPIIVIFVLICCYVLLCRLRLTG